MSIVDLVIVVYNSIMDKLQENYLEPFINLKGLLSQKIEQESKDDFLTFVRMMAPTIVSGFRMGRHIEIISNKLKKLEDGEINMCDVPNIVVIITECSNNLKKFNLTYEELPQVLEELIDYVLKEYNLLPQNHWLISL